MKRRVILTKIYTFSAAHRLHSADLSPAENDTIYGKCNNLYGHGHDYILEVSLAGFPDQQSGMLMDRHVMDNWVRAVLDTLDHKHLDREVEFFKTNHSTGEVIIEYIWDSLSRNLAQAELIHLKLWETNNNYFEIEEKSKQ